MRHNTVLNDLNDLNDKTLISMTRFTIYILINSGASIVFML